MSVRSSEDDLATIQEYCQRAAVAAVADAIRAQTGQLVPVEHPQITAIAAPPVDLDALTASQEPITLHPVPVREPVRETRWRLDQLEWALLGFAATALGLLVWIAVEVVWALGRAASAAGAAISAAAPAAGGIALLVLLALLLCRGGGGGRGFSGTFSGRMH